MVASQPATDFLRPLAPSELAAFASRAEPALDSGVRVNRAPWRFAWPVLLLLAEVAAFTPFVEFPRGPLEHLASARVSTALLFGLTAFFVLAWRQLAEVSQPRPLGPWRCARRLALHGILYALYGVFTHWLANQGVRSLAPSVAVTAWVVFTLAVGLSAMLAFLPWTAWVELGWRLRQSLTAALALAVTLAALSPWFRELWLSAHGPALAVSRLLLHGTYGEGQIGSAGGLPVLGTSRLRIQITPGCSDFDMVAAFWLLAGVLLLLRLRELRLLPFLAIIAAGTGGLYLLAAARLYLLVVVGLQISPTACVGLAHSRLGAILFLVVGAGLLGLSRRVAARPDFALSTESGDSPDRGVNDF